MPILFREDDPISSRWSGLGRLLTIYEMDHNWYQIDTRITTLEDNYTATISIDTISQPSSSTLLVTLTDATVLGPFTLPTAAFRDRGDWLADTPYLVNDTFIAPDGGLYRVLFAHTSDPTFDPNANDGTDGNDYYASMIPPRGNTIPAGGAVGMYFRKNLADDYVANWAFIRATEVVFSPESDSALVSDNVADAIHELEGLINTSLDALSISFTPTTDSALTSDNVSEALEELEGLIGAGPSTNALDVDFTPTTDSALASTNVSAALEELEGLIGSGSGTLGGLTDVTITAPADGDDLHYDNGSSQWVNGHYLVRRAGDTMTGALTLAADPASALQAATKQYVDGIALNLGKRARVRAATTANITIATALNNGDSLDGVTLATGDLVLVKNQSAPEENGIYVVGVSPARFAEFDTYDEHPGSLIAVAEGSTNADTIWLCTSNAGGTLNTTAIAFSQSSTSGALLAANDLSDLSSAANARVNIGLSVGAIEVVIDGGGSAITTGLKGYLNLPIAGTITEAKLLADQSGSIVVDVWKCTYAQFDAGATHPVSGDKITASAPPTISSATKSEDTTLTGWTTSFSAGDILAFNVNSATSITRVTLSLKYTK